MTAHLIDNVSDLIESFLGHLQTDLIVLVLLHQLVVAEKHAKGLARYNIAEPKEKIVRVARDDTLKLPLQHHGRDINHQYKIIRSGFSNGISWAPSV